MPCVLQVREAKETIFTKNSPGLSLFFLIKGRLAAKGDLGFEFFEMSQPYEALGEHALMRSKAMHTTHAKTRCELFAISLEDLFKLTVKLGHTERDAMAGTSSSFEATSQSWMGRCCTAPTSHSSTSTGWKRSRRSCAASSWPHPSPHLWTAQRVE